jgi:hypothetical protein
VLVAVKTRVHRFDAAGSHRRNDRLRHVDCDDTRYVWSDCLCEHARSRAEVDDGARRPDSECTEHGDVIAPVGGRLLVVCGDIPRVEVLASGKSEFVEMPVWYVGSQLRDRRRWTRALFEAIRVEGTSPRRHRRASRTRVTATHLVGLA